MVGALRVVPQSLMGILRRYVPDDDVGQRYVITEECQLVMDSISSQFDMANKLWDMGLRYTPFINIVSSNSIAMDYCRTVGYGLGIAVNALDVLSITNMKRYEAVRTIEEVLRFVQQERSLLYISINANYIEDSIKVIKLLDKMIDTNMNNIVVVICGAKEVEDDAIRNRIVDTIDNIEGGEEVYMIERIAATLDNVGMTCSKEEIARYVESKNCNTWRYIKVDIINRIAEAIKNNESLIRLE